MTTAKAVKGLNIDGAEHIVDNFHFGDVVGTADVEVFYQILAEELASVVITDAAKHGAEFVDG